MTLTSVTLGSVSLFPVHGYARVRTSIFKFAREAYRLSVLTGSRTLENDSFFAQEPLGAQDHCSSMPLSYMALAYAAQAPLLTVENAAQALLLNHVAGEKNGSLAAYRAAWRANSEALGARKCWSGSTSSHLVLAIAARTQLLRHLPP